MYKYIVYKTTNKINNYIYIGVHRTDIDIDDGYIGNGLYNSPNSIKQFKKYKFHNAVKKYGVKNFVRETLFEYEDSESGKRQAYKKEAELVNRDFLKRKDVYNTCLGGRVPSSINEREIAQYDLDGNFIRSYYSITHASQITGISNSGIQAACAGEIKYCKEFQWKYFYGDKSNIEKVIPVEKVVYQFDLQGNYITYYKSCTEASLKTGITKSSINDACNKKIRCSHGYYWSYIKKFEYIPKDKQGTSVACYDDDGRFIKSYSSLTDAANKLNVSISCLSRALSGYRKHCAKLRWRYFYGNTSNIESLKD